MADFREMTVEEVEAKRRETSLAISDLIRQFKKETGVYVTDIDYGNPVLFFKGTHISVVTDVDLVIDTRTYSPPPERPAVD